MTRETTNPPSGALGYADVTRGDVFTCCRLELSWCARTSAYARSATAQRPSSSYHAVPIRNVLCFARITHASLMLASYDAVLDDPVMAATVWGYV